MNIKKPIIHFHPYNYEHWTLRAFDVTSIQQSIRNYEQSTLWAFDRAFNIMSIWPYEHSTLRAFDITSMSYSTIPSHTLFFLTIYLVINAWIFYICTIGLVYYLFHRWKIRVDTSTEQKKTITKKFVRRHTFAGLCIIDGERKKTWY